eukprot:COSAG02_NODE_635_length_19251_cov_32.350982_4_plen_117_part_00
MYRRPVRIFAFSALVVRGVPTRPPDRLAEGEGEREGSGGPPPLLESELIAERQCGDGADAAAQAGDALAGGGGCGGPERDVRGEAAVDVRDREGQAAPGAAPAGDRLSASDGAAHR